jgi:NhaA family Na+:H+ antiporter
MIILAIIYALFNYKEPTITRWGIPMATDIAFALGILSLVGRKAPKRKNFMHI